MDKSKLLLTLKTLDKTELRTFKRFLLSKIFNQREPVVQLFDILREEMKSSSPKFDKQTIHSRLFSGATYKDKPVRDVMSYLLRVLEQFLAFQEMYEEPSDELLALCKSLRQRNLLKLFETTAEKTASSLQKTTIRDIEYHYRNYQLEQERYYAIIKKGRANATNLQEVTQSLDVSYFANRLRQCCTMLAHQNVYNTTYDFGMINEIIKEVERQELLHIPAINVYYYCYLAQTDPDNVEYFNALQHSLIVNADLFNVAEMKDLYLLAMNIAIKKLNQGAVELIPGMLELYKAGIEKKILLIDGLLSRFTYKNVIALALRLGLYDWVAEFIEEYTPLLEPDFSKETYRYNLAKLHYSKKEYEDALQLLFLNASSDDVYTNMDTKMLLSRIYYEQKDQDTLEALVKSYKAFIRRKKIISYHRLTYQNFINCIAKLIVLNPYDKQAKVELLKEFNALQPLPNRYWFIEQLS